MSRFRVTRFADAASFRERALDFLVAREAEHNLILGLSSQLQGDPHIYGAEPPYFAVVEEADTVVAAALQTPPNRLILSETERPDDVLAVLADELARHGARLPGVIAERRVARAFADAWAQRTGTTSTLDTRERIYRLEAVVPPRPAPGRMRVADERDRPLLVEWLLAFWTEVIGAATPEEAAAGAERWLANERTMYLWEDDGVVSMCGVSGPTPSGIRIGPVYTPPALRGRGYASACVAAASQIQLDAGRRFCFLYTDLANPTSNHVYRALGYEPVSEVDVYRFGSA